MSVDGGRSTLVMVQGRANNPRPFNSTCLLNEVMNRRGRGGGSRGRSGSRGRNGSRGRSGSGEWDVVDDDMRVSNNLKRLTKADKRRLLHEVRDLLGGGEMSLLSGSGVGLDEYDEEEDEDESLLALTRCAGDGNSRDDVGSTSLDDETNDNSTSFFTSDTTSRLTYPISAEHAAYVSEEEEEDDDDDAPPRSSRRGRQYFQESGGISSCVRGRGGSRLVVDEYDSLDECEDDDGVFVGTCNAILFIMTCGVTGLDGSDEISNDEGGRVAHRRARGSRSTRDSKTKRHDVRHVVDDDHRWRKDDEGWEEDRGSKNVPCPNTNNCRAMDDDPPLDRDWTVSPPGEFFNMENDDAKSMDFHDVDEDHRAVVHVIDDTLYMARAKSTAVAGSTIPSVVKPTLFARVRSLTAWQHHRSRDENDATTSSGSSSSIIVSDVPETLGRAKSLKLHHRMKHPFARDRASFSETRSSGIANDDHDDPRGYGVAAAYVTKEHYGGRAETMFTNPSSGTNNATYLDGPETFGIIACSTKGNAISRLPHKSKETWWEYTDDRFDKNYYSNGIVSARERPVDVTIHDGPHPSPKRSTRSRTTSPSKRDRQGPSSAMKGDKGKTSSTMQDRRRARSFFTKNRASHALATLVDGGGFRRALALSSGKLGNYNSRSNSNCPRQ